MHSPSANGPRQQWTNGPSGTGEVLFKTYRKPNWKPQYLSYHSQHLEACKMGIYKCEATRHLLNCSRDFDYDSNMLNDSVFHAASLHTCPVATRAMKLLRVRSNAMRRVRRAHEPLYTPIVREDRYQASYAILCYHANRNGSSFISFYLKISSSASHEQWRGILRQ